MEKTIFSIFTRACKFLCLVVLAGCATKSSVGAMDITGINYTDTVVEAFTVNGYPGPNVYPHGGGAGGVCCISVPDAWKPGMTVTIRWTDDRNANPAPWKTRVVEVPQYRPEDMGHFAVHFFPNDEVKVLVTMLYPHHPDYPLGSPKRKAK